jgi:imidazole glycerol phosphate synthase glutamine amidotransferase subunit
MILAIKAFWITLCVATLVSRPVYQFLLGLKSRQVISAFVPEGHQAKVGTPNMGGWIPVIGMIFMFVYFLFLPTSSMVEALGYSSTTTLMTVITPNYVYGVLSLLIGYALLGFADDYLVPKMKPGKRGIDWLPKLGLQIILALPCAWLTSNWNMQNAGATLFMILFFANAYNFSDGLDALAGSLLIGICVGMQMMGNKSDEGKMDGLKWIDSDILKFDESKIQQRTKLPHMGWNDVTPLKNHPLFIGLETSAIFYFLHSFYMNCKDEKNILASSDYGISFTSAVNCNNIYGVQFHPEKSHQYGEKLLYNFAKL